MRIIIIVLLVIIIGNDYTYCQSVKKTAWSYLELKGEVRQVHIISYEVKDSLGKITKNEIVSNYIIRYNHNGDWIEWRSFNPNLSNKWSENSKYDEKGRALERYDYSYNNSDSTLERKYKYKNDKYGNIIETICCNSSDSLLWKQIWKYDKKGNIVEMLYFAKLDSLTRKKISNYNNRNNLIEEINFDANGNLQGKTIYKYDDIGNNSEKIEYNSNDSLKNRITYKFNEYGQRIEVCNYNPETNLKKKITYQYKYDTHTNWIEKIDYINNSPVKITERQIDYY